MALVCMFEKVISVSFLRDLSGVSPIPLQIPDQYPILHFWWPGQATPHLNASLLGIYLLIVCGKLQPDNILFLHYQLHYHYHYHYHYH